MFAPGQQRLFRYFNEFAGFLEAKCTHFGALSIGDFDAMTCGRYSMLDSVNVNPGRRTGWFYYAEPRHMQGRCSKP
jgi:hypothetical protein